MIRTAARTAALQRTSGMVFSGPATASTSARRLSTSTTRASFSSFFGWLSRSAPSASRDDAASSSSHQNEGKAPPGPDHIVSAATASHTPSSTASTASPSASRSSSPSASAATTASTATTSPSPPSPPSSDAPKANLPIKGQLLARDQELLAKLLDREGGSAGVSIVNGRYEEGLGPETKKNMFRLI